jgi:hypothetical protein
MISSKVWKGLERIALAHYEANRQAKTTPTNLVGQVPAGAIPYQADRIDMKSLRYWGKGLRFTVDGVEVSTALDDMLQWPSLVGTHYAVIDLKSKSKPTDEAATAQLYRNQADVFDLAANTNGYTTEGIVYFDYWYPISVCGSDASGAPIAAATTHQVWGSQVIALKADHARIKALIKQAAACLESAMPSPDEDCPVCTYVFEREQLFETLKATA